MLTILSHKHGTQSHPYVRGRLHIPFILGLNPENTIKCLAQNIAKLMLTTCFLIG